MTFWEALPQIADIGGLTLGFLLLVGVFFAILRLVMPAASFIQDMMHEQKKNYQELLDKAETINARDLADERAERERLEKRLDQNDIELGRMNALLVEKNKQLTAQGESLAELTKTINSVREISIKKDQTIEEMRKAIRALENEVAELKAQNIILLAERDDWKEKFECAEQEIALLRSGVEAIQKRDTDKLTAPAVMDADDKADDKPAETKAAA